MSTLRKYQISTLLCIFVFIIFFRCSSNEGTSPNNTQQDNTFIKTLGGSLNDRAQSITQNFDGGYTILGYTQSDDGDVKNKQNTSFDYWLLKFNTNHNLEWQKTYGGSEDDRGNNIIQTNDGGYAVIGYSKSNDEDVTQNNGFNDFWILKLNNSGVISWRKSFGFSGSDDGISIIQTQDGGFLATGVLDVTASGGQGNSKTSRRRHAGGDYWAIKLNASGETQWSKFYGGTFTDTPYDVIQTNDNGYIMVGSSDSDDVDIKNTKGDYDFWVVKISETGSLVWEKSFGGDQIDEARGIEKTNDGNFMIVGTTRSNSIDVSQSNGAGDVWIIKISPSGDLLWEKTYGGGSFDSGLSISKTQDNGYLISGNSRSEDGDVSTNNGQNDIWLFKIDSNGTLKWEKSFGGSEIDLAFDAIQINNGNIITVGESSSSDHDIPENKGFTDLLIISIKKE